MAGGPWPFLHFWVPRSAWSRRLPQSPVRPRARLPAPAPRVGGPRGSDRPCARVLLDREEGGRGNLKRILQEPGLGPDVENGLLETSCARSRCAWRGKAKATLTRNLELNKIPEGFRLGFCVCIAVLFCSVLRCFVCGVGLAESNWGFSAIPFDPGLAWSVEGRQVGAGPRRPAPLSCACFPADAPRAVAGDGSAAAR